MDLTGQRKNAVLSGPFVFGLFLAIIYF